MFIGLKQSFSLFLSKSFIRDLKSTKITNGTANCLKFWSEEHIFITYKFFYLYLSHSLSSLLMKIHNKRELQNIATNPSADIDYKDFLNIYRKYRNES